MQVIIIDYDKEKGHIKLFTKELELTHGDILCYQLFVYQMLVLIHFIMFNFLINISFFSPNNLILNMNFFNKLVFDKDKKVRDCY
jgi:UDP-2,3-diacylglucosamine pyrophosphatase LpxH